MSFRPPLSVLGEGAGGRGGTPAVCLGQASWYEDRAAPVRAPNQPNIKGHLMAKKNRDQAPQGDDVFEGANHVLRGIRQQLTFWSAIEGREADRKTMVAALTTAFDALRDALQETKTRVAEPR